MLAWTIDQPAGRDSETAARLRGPNTEDCLRRHTEARLQGQQAGKNSQADTRRNAGSVGNSGGYRLHRRALTVSRIAGFDERERRDFPEPATIATIAASRKIHLCPSAPRSSLLRSSEPVKRSSGNAR